MTSPPDEERVLGAAVGPLVIVTACVIGGLIVTVRYCGVREMAVPSGSFAVMFVIVKSTDVPFGVVDSD